MPPSLDPKSAHAAGQRAGGIVADQAQFTPKMVETQTERDKLMFRVRVRIDPTRSTAHADVVRSGLPGVAFVQVDQKAAWPARLAGGQ